MVRGKLAVCVACAMVAGIPAHAQPCESPFGELMKGYSWTQFFRFTPFGTVGFSRDNGKHVYVPNPGVRCIALEDDNRPIRFAFNNRGASRVAASYVSFKIFGFENRQQENLWILSLSRTGLWGRGGKTLEAPWYPDADPQNRPDRIAAYENFGGSGSETDFDRQFGVMHGIPNQSQSDSWNGLAAMRSNPSDTAHVRYVAHQLQRFESSPDKTVPGSPVDYVTKRFEYKRLVLRTFSPLEGGQSSTLVFEFGG